jgi:hypothetical protein
MGCLFIWDLIFFRYTKLIHMRTKLGIGFSCFQVKVNSTLNFGPGLEFDKRCLSDVIIVPTEQCLGECDARYFMSVMVIF